MKKTDEEERVDLLKNIKANLKSQGSGKGGNTAALKFLAELEGFTKKDSKELFKLTADDYCRIEQQAQRELDDGVPPHFGGESEMPTGTDLLLDSFRQDSGQGTDEDDSLETLGLPD